MTRSGQADAQAMDDRIIAELAGWLEGVPEGAADRVADWSEAAWTRFRELVWMQGLGAVLALHLRQPGRAAVVPESTGAWLEVQEGRNAERVDRFHAELGAILRRASALGIEIIPLKGAYLAGIPATDPRRRPMADIDLLVRPAQRPAMRALLTDLGYRRAWQATVGPRPDTFLVPDSRVVDRSGENPDNPRPVDLHVTVQRHLWEWLPEDELTAALWASAAPGRLLGEPAMLPSPGVVFEHIAVHATLGLMRGRGRLCQWLDLARLAGAGGIPGTWVVPRLAFPSLAMAARVLPALGAAVDLDALATAALSPAVVARWAREVPLGGKAGLETGMTRVPPRGRAGAWERWRPGELRLAIAYGETPRAVATARHAARGVRHWVLLIRARFVTQARRRASQARRRVPRIARRIVRRVARSLGLAPHRAA